MSEQESNNDNNPVVDENIDPKDDGNLKAEFNRKMGNLQEQNQKLADQLANIGSQLGQMTSQQQASKQAEQQSNLEDLKYSDPDKYIEITQSEREKALEARLTQKQNEAMAKQNVLGSLVADYPELAKADSDIYKLASQISNNLNPSIRDTADGYKLAVREAAAQLGALSTSQRKKSGQSMDEFISGGSSGQIAGQGVQNQGADKLDPATEAFASLVGLDMSDKKQVERVKNHAKRKNWNRYK